MPRSFWKGAVSFGLVTIPIRLYTATESKDVTFHLLHAKDGVRIKQQRYCPEDDDVIPWNEVVRGYEYGPDQYVIMTDEDFEKVPVKTVHTIEIAQFVSISEIDPIHYERTYYIEPEEVGKKPYALLRRTLEESGRVAIAKVALRNKEQLCCLRVKDGVIVMETMLYPDEIKSHGELNLPEKDMKVSDRELTMATSLVDMLTEEFDPSRYKDEYRQAMLELIEAKAEGQEEVVRPAPAVGKVTDLMTALKASIEAAKRDKGAEPAAEAEEEEEEARARRRRRKAG
jgi:DNA end-binding protein Ku